MKGVGLTGVVLAETINHKQKTINNKNGFQNIRQSRNCPWANHKDK
jgi:hypothetical protein